MKARDTALLAEQLGTALREMKQAAGEPLEISILAGLIERAGGRPPELLEAAAWRDGDGSDVLDEALARMPIDDAVHVLTESSGNDSLEERTDRLFEIDELCAAAWWSDCPSRALPALRLAAKMIDAFPEPWQALAPLATKILSETPPAHGDPARHLWQAVEATRWHRDEEDSRIPECGAARRKLGISTVVVPRNVIRQERLSAASGLPPAPIVEVVASGAGWELALTERKSSAWFRLSSTIENLAVSATRDGADVELDRSDDRGQWSCLAMAGKYRWRIGSDETEVEVEP